MAKSFEELLFEGIMTAFRSLSLEELYQQREAIEDMHLPEYLAEFPGIVLAIAIAEKQNQRAMN